MTQIITQYKSTLIISLLCLFSGFGLMASASPEGEAYDPVPTIMHHLKDAHDWHLFDLKGDDGENHAVSIPLPVILYSAEAGFDVFMSSAFHHDEDGKVLAQGKYLNHHGKIYLANPQGKLNLEEAEDGHMHALNAKPFDFSITKNVVAMFISILLLVLIFRAVAVSYKKGEAPKGLAGFLEPLILFVRDDIAYSNINRKKADKFLPYLLTVFFFIWINNLLGLVPFFPGGANLTGNIAFTFTLAFFTLIVTNINGNSAYWKHLFMPPVPPALWVIMIPIELIGILIKPFALMIRLFANITAGHALMLSLVSIIFVMKSAGMAGLSIPFMLFMNILELLVAALQAYIFTLLSALFIGMAVEEAHH